MEINTKMHIRRSPWGMSLYAGYRPQFAGFGMGLGPDPEDGLIASTAPEKIEELVSLAESLGATVQKWWEYKAASGAPGKRTWHVIRNLDGPGLSGENLLTPTGRVKTFATYEQAQKAAEKANKREES